jgi:hypothetical protein
MFAWIDVEPSVFHTFVANAVQLNRARGTGRDCGSSGFRRRSHATRRC